jgi:hypothetical protein
MIGDILSDPAKTMFVVLFIIMLAELSMALFFFITTRRAVANSRTAVAKIVRLEPQGPETKLHLSFKDPLGKTINATLLVRDNTYKNNQEVEILSHKEKPEEVRLNSFRFLWAVPLILANGVVFFAVVLAILVSQDIAKPPF